MGAIGTMRREFGGQKRERGASIDFRGLDGGHSTDVRGCREGLAGGMVLWISYSLQHAAAP